MGASGSNTTRTSIEPMAQPQTHDDSGLWIVLALVLLLLVPGVFMMGFWGTGMMGGAGWSGMSWGGWLGVALGVGVVAVVLFLVLRAVQATPHRAYPAYPAWQPAPPPGAPPGAMNAVQILDARYAKGEITRDEYLRMRADLEGRAH